MAGRELLQSLAGSCQHLSGSEAQLCQDTCMARLH